MQQQQYVIIDISCKAAAQSARTCAGAVGCSGGTATTVNPVAGINAALLPHRSVTTVEQHASTRSKTITSSCCMVGAAAGSLQQLQSSFQLPALLALPLEQLLILVFGLLCCSLCCNLAGVLPALPAAIALGTPAANNGHGLYGQQLGLAASAAGSTLHSSSIKQQCHNRQQFAGWMFFSGAQQAHRLQHRSQHHLITM